MKYLLCMLSFFFSHQIGFSQSSNCSELIKTLLPSGIYEYDNINISEGMYHSVISWYKSHSDETYSEVQKKSAFLTVPIDDVLIGLGLSSSDSSYNKFIHDIETYYNEYSEHHLKIKNSWSHINTEVIEKLNGCFQAERGVRAVKIITGELNQIIVRFFYNNDYLGAPSIVKISIQQKTDNIKISERVVESIRLINGDHKDILIKKTDNKSATIIFKINARTAPNSELSFEIPVDYSPVSDRTKNDAEIANGELKENAVIVSEWGGAYGPNPNPDLKLTNNWRKVPMHTEHINMRAGWVYTKAETNSLKTKGYYNWQIEITNKLGGRSGPGALGGSGEVEPSYRTTITLPTLKNDSQSYYSLKIKCGTYCREGDERAGIGAKGKVTITGKDFEKSFNFTVDHDFNFESLPLDSIKSGEYTLLMQMPKILGGSRGLHPDAPDAATTLIFETKLSTDVSAHEIVKPEQPQPKRKPEDFLYYYIAAGVVLIGLFLFFFLRKKNKF